MSILVSKLVSVFTADTHDLKKGYDETRRGAKEVTSELKKTEDQANKTAQSFLSMAKKAAKYLLTAAAAGKTARDVISEAANMVALDNFAYSIDQSVESVDAFTNAIITAGGSASDAQSTLSTLFSKVKEASADSASSAAEDFRRIGVSVKDANGQTKDLISVLYDLSGAVEGMDASKAREYIEAIGITDRTVVEAMLQGRRELEQMIRTQKELGVVSKESAEKARAFDATINRMSLSFKRTKQDITDAFLPAFTWVADKMEWVADVISDNSTIVIGAIGGIAVALGVTLIPVLWSTAAAVIAATWPFLLMAGIAALVGAAIYALYEDFKFFESGQDSFIGKLMDKYPFLGQAIVDVFEAIGAAADWVADTIKWAMEAIGVDMKDSKGVISTVINAILGLFNKLAKWGYILAGSLEYSWGLLKDGLKSLKKFFIDTFEWIWDGIQPFIKWIGEALDNIIGPIKWVLEKLGIIDGAEVNIDHNFEENAAKRSNVETMGKFVPSIADAVADEAEQKATGKASAEFVYLGIVPEMTNKAQAAMNQVVTEPLNSVTSNQISNLTTKSESRSYSLEVGEIKIETQATDANGIAMGVTGALQDYLKSLEAEAATGIAR